MYEDDWIVPGAIIAGGGIVLASPTPEPVLADPVSGLPLAVAGDVLPVTGAAVGQWWLLGVAAVLLGLALVVASRWVRKPVIETEP
jgi:LPXTG-motif cell wall-anchored protein